MMSEENETANGSREEYPEEPEKEKIIPTIPSEYRNSSRRRIEAKRDLTGHDPDDHTASGARDAAEHEGLVSVHKPSTKKCRDASRGDDTNRHQNRLSSGQQRHFHSWRMVGTLPASAYPPCQMS
jgi:hypothetical protein